MRCLGGPHAVEATVVSAAYKRWYVDHRADREHDVEAHRPIVPSRGLRHAVTVNPRSTNACRTFAALAGKLALAKSYVFWAASLKVVSALQLNCAPMMIVSAVFASPTRLRRR